MVNLVKCHPVDELVAKLKSGKTISKEQVVRESKLILKNGQSDVPKFYASGQPR